MTAGAVEYLAETYGGDARSSVFLGGIITPTRRFALRWLRGQARRIADALDPPPYVRWAPPGPLRRIPAVDRDAPGALRGWRASTECQDAALRALAADEPFAFLTHDATCWYRLTVHPLPGPIQARTGTRSPT
ncbi:hypothetical protein B9W68_13900 [Streptomyces sp. CS227]|uniref:hypothetical protein n=1 Tax=Streptomyces sp. CS227 TaxID=1982763 RepID=UPI000B408031|nr:hypothetical protein [Streptomyces sp. CS227]OWA10939.1 hypothetical protein B9W68_13900 [Streptomyces sp. CS227]